MGQITRFAVRTNGRVLADVRRPVASKPAPKASPIREAAKADIKPKSVKKSDG